MRVELIVPRTDYNQFRALVLRPILMEYGGATLSDVNGYWLDERANVIIDKNRLVVVYVQVQEQDARLWFNLLAQDIAKWWDQECIFIAFDGDHYLVDREGHNLVDREGHVDGEV